MKNKVTHKSSLWANNISPIFQRRKSFSVFLQGEKTKRSDVFVFVHLLWQLFSWVKAYNFIVVKQHIDLISQNFLPRDRSQEDIFDWLIPCDRCAVLKDVCFKPCELFIDTIFMKSFDLEEVSFIDFAFVCAEKDETSILFKNAYLCYFLNNIFVNTNILIEVKFP